MELSGIDAISSVNALNLVNDSTENQKTLSDLGSLPQDQIADTALQAGREAGKDGKLDLDDIGEYADLLKNNPEFRENFLDGFVEAANENGFPVGLDEVSSQLDELLAQLLGLEGAGKGKGGGSGGGSGGESTGDGGKSGGPEGNEGTSGSETGGETTAAGEGAEAGKAAGAEAAADGTLTVGEVANVSEQLKNDPEFAKGFAEGVAEGLQQGGQDVTIGQVEAGIENALNLTDSVALGFNDPASQLDLQSFG
ncbi:MAG: hypothetical protein AAGE61_04660 [Pseudomonadota bacterium]